MRKVFLLSIISIMQITCMLGQDITAGADVFNRYIWRGLDLGGKSGSIQPWAKLAFGSEKHIFGLGFWGAYSLAPSVNDEVDLYLSYTFNNTLTFTFTDYFFPGLNSGIKDKYFEYGKDSTGHILEGMVQYNGSEKIPFTFLLAMIFYGNDSRKSSGDIFMSNYIEGGYKRNFKGVDFNLFAGFSLNNPKEELGETSFYLNDGPGIINLGIKVAKPIEITEKFSLPLQCSLITNPELNKIYLTFGISLNM